MELADTAVEIPMIGWGASLNVAVAGSLVLYRLAGCPRLSVPVAGRVAASVMNAVG
jgi:hypothetical protein